MNTQELAQKGDEIYRRKYKEKFEKKYPGKYAAIDVYSEDYTIADSPEEATEKAAEKHPKGFFHLIRIGFDAVYRISSFLSHENQSIF